MKTLNKKESVGLYSLLVLGVFLLMSSYAYASPDYYNYWTWNTGYSTAYGVDGWVDGGTDKIIFYSGPTAYIYQVTTTSGSDGDNPNLHPLNPDATGAIAPRVFTYDSEFALNSSNYGHDDAFYVGSDGFYLGTAWNGIEKYDFSGNYLATIAPAKTDDWVQGLAYDEASQSWWTAGGTSRNVWKYDMANTSAGWTHEFTYTPPVGSDHHDGLEVLSNGNLLFADYAGQIVEYQQDGTFVAQHLHDPFSTELESMGAGALGHYWGGSHSGLIFEFGGGSLPPSNQPPVADAGPDQTVEQDSHAGASVTLDGSGSSDPDADPLTYAWTWAGGSASGVAATVTLPLGTRMVTLTVSDGQASDTDTVDITVEDTADPVVTIISVVPEELWSPNHGMVPVIVLIEAEDICTETDLLEVSVNVTSNEPDDDKGDGAFTGDVDGQDGFTAPVPVICVFDEDTGYFVCSFELRAERDGRGDGRVYTIEAVCEDASGNIATETMEVTVAHDQGKGKK